jgi:hypothetical protein
LLLTSPLGLLAAGGIGAQAGRSAGLPPRLDSYLATTVRPTAAERKRLMSGGPVTKLLDADASKEVAVFGAVWIEAPARRYVEAVEDYFWTALELRMLLPDLARGPGFWLVTINRSRSDGLSGFRGLFVRRRVRSEAVNGVLAALMATKNRLEQPRSRPSLP